MKLLDRQSLSKTVDRVNACFFAGDAPDLETSNAVIDWIVTRHAAPNAYAGTFGLTPGDEQNRLHAFTGEPLTSRASLRHIHAEETCRALILLNGIARRAIPQLDAASESLLACFRRSESKGGSPGTYCCGACSVGLWRHMLVGGLGTYAEHLDRGIGELKRFRDAEGAWRRFPFYYTLLALTEARCPSAEAELRYVRPLCERRLKFLRGAAPFVDRRRRVLELALERAG